MRVTVLATAAALVSAVLISACGSGAKAPAAAPTTGNGQPDGAAILAESAVVMGSVESVHFRLEVKGSITGIAVYGAEADIKKSGDARGTASVDIAQQQSDIDFVILGPTLYFRTAGGAQYQQIPLSLASTLYDPSAVLDPDRGVGKLLSSAQAPITQGTENVDGKPAYKVRFNPDPSVLTNVVPGANTPGATATAWVDQSTKRTVKALFEWPASAGGGSVTATFTAFNKAISITAP